MNKFLKYVAYAVCGLSTVLIVYMLFLPSLFKTSSQKNWSAMEQSPFVCKQGTEVTYKGWSKNGRMRYCEPVKNGAWEAWSSSYKNIQGTYRNGKYHGTWTWYRKDGRIYRIKEYENGVELSDRIIEKE